MPDALRGPRGPEGEPGQDGRAGKDGAPGPQGPIGPQGEPGQQGEQGPAGRDGTDGADGKPGADGKDGKDGARGPRGERGPKGDKGETGESGADGLDGQAGPMPAHRWEGTALQFERPDGAWGKAVDLRGPAGANGGGGGGGQGMTPLQALQLQTLLDIFGGWISAAPVATIDEVTIDALDVTVEGSATGFYTTLAPATPGQPVGAEWEWDWGDGSAVSTTQNASHTYAESGTYTVSFRAKNHIGWSEPVTEEVEVSESSEGVLSLSAAVTSAAVDLSALGTVDWALFDSTSGTPGQRKSTGGSLIGVVAGFGTAGFNAGTGVSVSWSDGTPDASGSTTTAIYKASIDNTTGIESTDTDAGTTEYVLRLGVAGYNGTIMVDASLSDSSAPAVVGFDTNIVAPDSAQVEGYVDIQFKAASGGQSLAFRLWMDGSATPFSSAVTIQYATLMPV